MTAILFLHIFSVAFWLGCVAVEIVIERSRRGSFENQAMVARLHYQIDLFVEIPTFTSVLITGLLMLDVSRMSGLYLMKVVFGLLAILINGLCVIPVIKRKLTIDRGQKPQAYQNSKWIDRAAGVGIPLGLIALGIGIYWIMT